jgi:site-specific recombinase XerD
MYLCFQRKTGHLFAHTGRISNGVGRAHSTRAIYVRAAEELYRSVCNRPGDLTAVEIDAYLSRWRTGFELRYGRSPSAATYRNRVESLRAFYAWMERFDHLRAADGTLRQNPMRWVDAPRVDQRANDWLRPSEDQALLAASVPPHEFRSQSCVLASCVEPVRRLDGSKLAEVAAD